MKKIIWAVITIGFILLVNWGTAHFFNSNFFEWTFLSGLLVTIIIRFFSSSGGFMSDLADSRLQSTNNDEQWLAVEVWTKIDRQKRTFRPTTAFYVAFWYTVLTGIITFIYFINYFIS